MIQYVADQNDPENQEVVKDVAVVYLSFEELQDFEENKEKEPEHSQDSNMIDTEGITVIYG